MVYSKNGIALVIILLEALLSALGVEFEAGSIEKLVEGVVVALGLALAIINQVQRWDTKWFILKK